MIIIGKEIEKRLKEMRISIPEFASSINRSRPVVYNIFKRASIDTDLLQKISQILQYDFFVLYRNEYPAALNEPAEKYPISSPKEALLRKEIKDLEEKLSECKKAFISSEEKYEVLKRLNGLLEEKLSIGKPSKP